MRVGLDDIGTGNGNLQGFTCVLLDEAASAMLEAEGRRILLKHGLPRFHGKDFNPSNASHVLAFNEFFGLIKRSVESHGGRLIFQLFHRTIYNELFNGFATRLTRAVAEQVAGESTRFLEAYAQPLVWLARHLGDIPGPVSTGAHVQIDFSQPEDVQAQRRHLWVSGHLATIREPQVQFLVSQINSYKRQMFPKGPGIESLEIVEPSASIVTQAADVVGHAGAVRLRMGARRGPRGGAREVALAELFLTLATEDQTADLSDFSVDADNNLRGEPNSNILVRLVGEELS